MQPKEYDYYIDKLTPKETKDYFALISFHKDKTIDDEMFNMIHRDFWATVKERVDKDEKLK